MANKTFHYLDVFAGEKYAGNQLAVFTNGGAFSDKEMQQIAREINFSETTFILQNDDGFRVRIFTPAEEIPFAGHPTLGTAYVIRKEIIREPVSEVTLNLMAGKIPVTFIDEGNEAGVLFMRQNPPKFGRSLDPAEVAPVLGLSVSDVNLYVPVQEVSTGLFHLIVPLNTLDAVRRARVQREKYLKLLETCNARSLLVFSPETYHRGNDLNVRVFADYYGVPEDPATGSGNGCLAGYLVKHRFFGGSTIDVRVEQGYEIGRPSLLYLQAEDKGEHIEVRVGGRVIPVASGTWL